MGEKLVIIGNGFDLAAGLNSDFKTFYEQIEKPKIDKWMNSISIYSDEVKDVNFISLLIYNTFYEFRNASYSFFRYEDVILENQKKFKQLLNISDYPSNWVEIELFVKKILTDGFNKLSIGYNEIYLQGKDTGRGLITQEDDISIFFYNCRTFKKYGKIDFSEFVYNELKLFESSFKDYLTNDVKQKWEDYAKRSAEIFAEIVPHCDNGVVLNFNYTNPSLPNSFKQINVHGSLKDKEIIIGIDGNDASKEFMIPFTKTYRKLLVKSNLPVLASNYDEIIIFGHSLGGQDYSYFQSIFDYVDLYHGKTKISYIYSDYFIDKNKTTPLQRKTEVADSLFALMNNYGQTLDNKDHGKNLLHKLLLEGRIELSLKNFGK